MHHLRKGISQEWKSFPVHAKESRLNIHFNVKDSSRQATIRLRQYDVNQQWEVLLNGSKLGNLTVDEKDMISYFEVPPGLLKIKGNTFQIRSASDDPQNQVSDDIKVGQVLLDQRPLERVLSEVSVQVEITDAETRRALPARITIADDHGSLQPVTASNNDLIAVRAGVIYAGDGRAAFSLPAGSYKIYASRGFEYGVDSVSVVVKPGDRIQKKLSIRHEVPAEGWVSCDPHIHTFTYSGHGDATVRERILTIAGEGLDLPVITEHNAAIDIRPAVEKMGMSRWITPVTGNEVTTSVGHFNIFPVSSATAVTDHLVKDWNELSKNISKTKDVKVVILNHARDIHNGFRPFDPKHHVAVAGKDLNGWTFPANAMEVMNSGSQQTDPAQLYLDWMGMINHGYFLTPVGSSDSHEVSRFMVGQARTYIRRAINANDAIKNFTEGKVAVSFGLLTEILVDSLYSAGDLVPSSGKLLVSLKVSGPAWVQADRITLYANGQKIRESAISKNPAGGIKWQGRWILPKPPHDLFLVAVAEGPDPQVPFWPIAKPFQHSSPVLTPVVMGLTGIVRIDADNDGQFTSAYDYAKALWDSSKKDVSVYIGKLKDYDRSVAIQAAAVMNESGVDIRGNELTQALLGAPLKVRQGFIAYINSMQ